MNTIHVSRLALVPVMVPLRTKVTAQYLAFSDIVLER